MSDFETGAVPPHLRSPFDREAEARKRLEDPEEFAKAPPAGAQNTLVYKPTMSQKEIFGDARALTCGSCYHYRHKVAQEKMLDEDFLNVLIHEHEWKVKHLCDDPRVMAICDQHGDMLVGPMTKSCEQYREDRGAVVIPMKSLTRGGSRR